MEQFGDICVGILGIVLLILPFSVIPRLMKKSERNPESNSTIPSGDGSL